MKYDYCPSRLYLKKSFKDRSKEYFLHNTVHGVPYFADSTRPMWERITWLFLTLSSTLVALGIILLCWDKFQQYPTLTGIDTNVESISLDFPQIQFCYDWPELNHSSLKEDEKEFLMKIYNWNWEESTETPISEHHKFKNFRNVFYQLGHDCGIVHENCSFRGVPKECGDYLKKVITAAGVCCKFASDRLGISENPRAFIFTPKIYPFRLYLLDKLDSGPHRYVRPVEIIEGPTRVSIHPIITSASSNIKYLTLSQRQCHYDEPSFNDCELNCISENIFESCGCLPWFSATSDSRECHVHEYSCIKEKHFDTSECKCTLTCDNTSYPPKKIESRDDEICVVDIPFWPKGVYKREVSYGFLDLLVASGGIAGLFIGYSILTTVELGYYFSLRPYCGAVLEASHSKVNIFKVQQAAVKAPRQVVVKPVYFDYVN